MQTYKYRFPASGTIDREHAAAAQKLTHELKDGMDCVGAWCIFPSDSDVIDHVSLDIEGKDFPFTVTAVNVHTYTKPYDGVERDFLDCVHGNLEYVAPSVKLTGEIEFMGREGNVPETLYHITERNNVANILENGLIPASGTNRYKSDSAYIYMADEKNLAPWLAVLPHLQEPVILKIDIRGLNNIEQGRVFSDRSFIESYTEYRTATPISPDRITVLGSANDKPVIDRLDEALQAQLDRAKDVDRHEAVRGKARFAEFDPYNDFTAAVTTMSFQTRLPGCTR